MCILSLTVVKISVALRRRYIQMMKRVLYVVWVTVRLICEFCHEKT